VSPVLIPSYSLFTLELRISVQAHVCASRDARQNVVFYLDRQRPEMQLSTCLWGGFYNPIIPVSGTIPDVQSRPIRGRLPIRSWATLVASGEYI
jgi:hypothetical protein